MPTCIPACIKCYVYSCSLKSHNHLKKELSLKQCLSDFNVHINYPVILLIYKFWFKGLDEAWEPACLSSSQVMLKIHVYGPLLQVHPVLEQGRYFYVIERLMWKFCLPWAFWSLVSNIALFPPSSLKIKTFLKKSTSPSWRVNWWQFQIVQPESDDSTERVTPEREGKQGSQ